MSFKELIINAGSSSLKYQVFEMPEAKVLAKGIFEQIGTACTFTHKVDKDGEEVKLLDKKPVEAKDHHDAITILLETLTDKETGVLESMADISAVGHRVLHAGEVFDDSVLITPEVMVELEKLIPLGPLHQPANIAGIKACEELIPGVPQDAGFDTTFHSTMPDYAYRYAIPKEAYTKWQIRKYGFHGTSHKFVSQEAAKFLGKPLEELKLVTAHIGNGASLAAIKYGKVVDTTMGLTPLDGLPMGTRCGTIDPAIIDFICRKENLTVQEVNNILNKKSGYIGFYPESSDARALRAAQAEGNKKADLILRMQSKKIVDYVGSFYAYMGGMDALVFTAGIGEKSPQTRFNVCERLKEAFGIEIDAEKNQVWGETAIVSKPTSKVAVLVIPTNEELMIAREVMKF